jgi:hypothetical protein
VPAGKLVVGVPARIREDRPIAPPDEPGVTDLAPTGESGPIAPPDEPEPEVGAG